VRMPSALLALASLLAVGCSGGAHAEDRGTEAVAGVESASVSGFQAVIVADNHVDRSEYERAMFAYKDCLEVSGVETEEMREQGGLYTLELKDPTDADIDAALECDGMYKSLVEPLYAADHIPSEEEMEREHDAWLECLRSKGYEIPIGAGPDVVNQVLADAPLDELVACHGVDVSR